VTDKEYRRLMKTPMPAGCYSFGVIRRYFSLVLKRELSDEEVRETIDRVNREANTAECLGRFA
jgi:hypothetical protein